MTLFVCLDDNMGMAFARRRQSRDSAVCADMVKSAAGGTLWMDSRSLPLFEGLGAQIAVLPGSIGVGDSCFIELESPGELAAKAEKIVLYRWNRRYPADLRFDLPLEGWTLTETVEFPGTSHEKITKETYIK